jgi:hypothetical protein
VRGQDWMGSIVRELTGHVIGLSVCCMLFSGESDFISKIKQGVVFYRRERRFLSVWNKRFVYVFLYRMIVSLRITNRWSVLA